VSTPGVSKVSVIITGCYVLSNGGLMSCQWIDTSFMRFTSCFL